MAATCTAHPFGVDGYESFVGKGACRKCGCVAHWKRKCQRCRRKFCSTCAPKSLQRYGTAPQDECCIGCEPFLVVAPDEGEPIFELEPESEKVTLNCHEVPIHVPLSAILWFEDEPKTNHKKSETVSYGPSTKKEECDASAAATDSSSMHSESPPWLATTGIAEIPSWQAIQERLFAASDTSNHRQASVIRCTSNGRRRQPQASSTPPPSNRCATLTDVDLMEPPLTPEAGCCTACRVYSTGKKPCRTCGTKYCRESRCQEYLYKDGSCAKCRIKPRPAKIPVLPVDTGCCTVCRQYAMGKVPCETCGMKYCQEAACQSYLFSNGSCVMCHGNI